MIQTPRVPKRITTALFSSLQAGVTPRMGLEHMVVGRTSEINALLDDLETIADGGAAFRIITGRYGSGKSFLLQLMRQYAVEREYVVADADLSPERRLTGSNGQGLATYRELVRNLSTKTRPNGDALKVLLERWLNGIQQAVVESGTGTDHPDFQRMVEQSIHRVTAALQSLVHGFDFAQVVSAYHRGHVQMDDGLQTNALRWLRGEYTAKTDARRDLGVRVVIDDDGWYDYVKLLAEFVRLIGYKGLVVLIDEAVNLLKISNTVSRNNNYEKLLTILNDTLQGKAAHMAVFLGGTPKFVMDEQRGLYSYEALRSRLQTSAFSTVGRRDMSTPVIMLDTLSNEETLALLRRVLVLHGMHHAYEPQISHAELLEFMKHSFKSLGASDLQTPRTVLRNFVTALNLLQQHPEETFLGILHGRDYVPVPDDSAVRVADEEKTDDEGVEARLAKAANVAEDEQYSEFEL